MTKSNLKNKSNIIKYVPMWRVLGRNLPLQSLTKLGCPWLGVIMHVVLSWYSSIMITVRLLFTQSNVIWWLFFHVIFLQNSVCYSNGDERLKIKQTSNFQGRHWANSSWLLLCKEGAGLSNVPDQEYEESLGWKWGGKKVDVWGKFIGDKGLGVAGVGKAGLWGAG